MPFSIVSGTEEGSFRPDINILINGMPLAFLEVKKPFWQRYPYKDIDIDTVKYVMKDSGYNPSETETPEFEENMSVTTPCNSFVTSLFDDKRFLYFLQYGIMFLNEKVPQKHNRRIKEYYEQLFDELYTNI